MSPHRRGTNVAYLADRILTVLAYVTYILARVLDKGDNMDGEDYATKLNEDLEKIKAYRKSLEEEFASTEANDPTIPAKAKKKVFELIPDAGVQISYLMKHAESESIRANLSKWVFDVCLKEAARKGDDDTMEKLIADLTGGQPA